MRLNIFYIYYSIYFIFIYYKGYKKIYVYRHMNMF